MTIIDSQVHVYDANTPKRPWHSVPNWPDHVTGDEMVAAMDKVGVDGAIFISAFSSYRYDASYAVEVQRAHPDRFAIVKPVDPDDPAVADHRSPSRHAIHHRPSGHHAAARAARTGAALGRPPEGAGTRQAPERGDQGQRRLHAVPATVTLPGHLGPACPRVRCLGFRSLLVGHGLDARVRSRQLRAGRRALP